MVTGLNLRPLQTPSPSPSYPHSLWCPLESAPHWTAWVIILESALGWDSGPRAHLHPGAFDVFLLLVAFDTVDGRPDFELSLSWAPVAPG